MNSAGRSNRGILKTQQPMSAHGSAMFSAKGSAKTSTKGGMDEDFTRSHASGMESGKPKVAKGNIEEEFIGNLQQQIYFLELEIKMLKDKEAQHGGLMNDSAGGPLTENIFHLRNKYQQIQRGLEAQIDDLAHENKLISSQNGNLVVNMDRAVKDRSDYEIHYRKSTSNYDHETNRLRKAISEADYETKEKIAQTKVYAADRENGRTRAGEYKLSINKIKLEINTMEEQLGTMEEEKGKKIEELNKLIFDNTVKVREYEREKARNTAQTFLETENKDLQQRRNELILEQDSCKNRISMLEHSRNVQENKCKQLIAEKKELQDEINQIQAILDDEKSQTNSQNQIAEKLKDKEQQEVLVAKNNVGDAQAEAKFQQEVGKRKQDENTKLNERNNELKFELEEKKIKVAKMRKNNAKALKHLITIDAEHKENRIKSQEIEERNNDMKEKIEISKNEGKSLLIENHTLKDKVNYLMRKIEINEQLKNVDVDELKTLSKTNVQMNTMIGSLIDKWDSVRRQNEFEAENRRDY